MSLVWTKTTNIYIREFHSHKSSGSCLHHRAFFQAMRSEENESEGISLIGSFFLCPMLCPLSHMRSDEPPSKIFAAKKNYKYTTTEKVFLKD